MREGEGGGIGGGARTLEYQYNLFSAHFLRLDIVYILYVPILSYHIIYRETIKIDRTTVSR